VDSEKTGEAGYESTPSLGRGTGWFVFHYLLFTVHCSL